MRSSVWMKCASEIKYPSILYRNEADTIERLHQICGLPVARDCFLLPIEWRCIDLSATLAKPLSVSVCVCEKRMFSYGFHFLLPDHLVPSLWQQDADNCGTSYVFCWMCAFSSSSKCPYEGIGIAASQWCISCFCVISNWSRAQEYFEIEIIPKAITFYAKTD